MITQASVTIAPDGGVLFTLPRTGMDLGRETVVQARDGLLRIGQQGKVFVRAELDDQGALAAIAATDDLTVVEVDDAGFVFHEIVRKV